MDYQPFLGKKYYEPQISVIKIFLEDGMTL